jgi:hypothetical protein
VQQSLQRGSDGNGNDPVDLIDGNDAAGHELSEPDQDGRQGALYVEVVDVE